MPPRPGLSVDTFPTINELVKVRKELDDAVAKLSRSPAAEHVALVAACSTRLAATALGVVTSLGLPASTCVELATAQRDPGELYASVFAIVTRKEEQQ